VKSESAAARYALSNYLRDLFGNPFKGIVFDSAWVTSTVVALGRSVYETEVYFDLPILADALEEAGCTHEGVLNHCRGPGPHILGCWVVDLVVGRSKLSRSRFRTADSLCVMQRCPNC
jgi:hypothetical protein